LLRLDEEILAAELGKAKASSRQAQVDLTRIQNLVRKNAASEDQLAKAKTAVQVALAELKLTQTRHGHTRVIAPFDGLLSERHAEPGDVVPRHTHVLTLIDPGSLVSELRVSDLLLASLNIGDPVQIRIDALGSSPFDGHVTRIYPEVDATTRLGTIEVSLDRIPAGARAGQLCRIRLQTAPKPRIMIPFGALQRDRNDEFVYLYGDDGTAQRAAVTSGVRVSENVEIDSGLTEGQRVIVRGFLGLREGKKVSPVKTTKTGEPDDDG